MLKTPLSKQTISISTGTILKALGLVLLLWFLWLARDIVVIVIFTFILTAAIDPLVDRLGRAKIPRAVSVILIYLLVVAISAAILTLLVPPIAEQINQLVTQLPGFFLGGRFDLLNNLQQIAKQADLADSLKNLFSIIGETLGRTTGGIFSTVSSFFGGVFSVTAIAVLTFYLTTEEKGIKKFFQMVVPPNNRTYVNNLVDRIQLKLGAWLRSYFFLGLIVGTLIYIGLLVIGVKFALVLALLAGAMEFIPFIGPLVAIIPALFLAVTDRPILALFVLILYFVVNQFENHVLVPRIMSRTVGLSPVIIVLVVLIGAKLAGFVGILLALPITITLAEIGKDFFRGGRFNNKRLGSA